jgi:hypothetical protein
MTYQNAEHVLQNRAVLTDHTTYRLYCEVRDKGARFIAQASAYLYSTNAFLLRVSYRDLQTKGFGDRRGSALTNRRRR